MSDNKPLKVVLSDSHDVDIVSSTNQNKRVKVGKWDTIEGRVYANIWILPKVLVAETKDALRYAIADRVPAIAEFVSQRCEK